VRFEVSEPGTPILVKVSYFPNWRASGADGPWRVTPNLMVVIPTDTSVELTYGRSDRRVRRVGAHRGWVWSLVVLVARGTLAMPVWTA
jgi:uncharacterized membrane protein